MLRSTKITNKINELTCGEETSKMGGEDVAGVVLRTTPDPPSPANIKYY
jgi:hypothetical protein